MRDARSRGRSGAGWAAGPVWTGGLDPGLLCSRRPLQRGGLSPGEPASPGPESAAQCDPGEWLSLHAGQLIWRTLWWKQSSIIFALCSLTDTERRQEVQPWHVNTIILTLTPRDILGSPIDLNLYVFGLWEETGKPGGKPHRHRENSSPHTSPGLSCQCYPLRHSDALFNSIQFN